MSQLERAAEREWKRGAAQVHFGRCDGCGRNRDDDGTFLLVVRRPRSSRRLCLRCWDERQR